MTNVKKQLGFILRTTKTCQPKSMTINFKAFQTDIFSDNGRPWMAKTDQPASLFFVSSFDLNSIHRFQPSWPGGGEMAIIILISTF